MKYDAILISGTPASGKDTLSERLATMSKDLVNFIKHKGCEYSNKSGNYHFLSKEDFEKEIRKGNFIQYHERYGNYYGIHKNEIKKLREKNKIPLIHVGKHKNLVEILNSPYISNALSLFIYVHKIDTKIRLKNRHSDNFNEVKMRLKSFDEELNHIKKIIQTNGQILFHKIFKNNYKNIDEASAELFNIIQNYEISRFISKHEIEKLISNE